MPRIHALKHRALAGARRALGAIAAASVIVSLLCFIANDWVAQHQAREDTAE